MFCGYNDSVSILLPRQQQKKIQGIKEQAVGERDALRELDNKEQQLTRLTALKDEKLDKMLIQHNLKSEDLQAEHRNLTRWVSVTPYTVVPLFATLYFKTTCIIRPPLLVPNFDFVYY